VILLYFLLATERSLVERTAAAIRAPRTRALVLAGMRQAERDIGLFISTMVLINVVLASPPGSRSGRSGLPNPVLWGTTTAVLACIPYLGPL
jgi:predicted PurR-regulated permease PerM